MLQQSRTVILAAGDFPSAPPALGILDAAREIICCDSAADELIRHGRTPDYIVGDLDSISPELRRDFPDRIIHVAEQETNDLTKAFRFSRSLGRERLTILGATGKREDHALGNISLLADFAEELPDIEMVTNHGSFSVALSSGNFPSRRGEQISFFAIDSGTRVTSEGLKYPMKDLLLQRWWQATLNEALGEDFSLDITPGRRLLIYRAFGSRM